MDCQPHSMNNIYIFTHFVASLVFLHGFLVEIYGNLSQVTNNHANQDQHGLNLTCSDSIPVTYDR